jgi:tetratricopeptide (TPR) repeat protein
MLFMKASLRLFLPLLLLCGAALSVPRDENRALLEAKAAFEKAPSTATADALVSFFMAPGNRREGIAWFESRRGPAALYGLGTLLMEEGRLDEARARLEDCARAFEGSGPKTEHALALMRLGVALENLNDYGAALALYRRALALGGETGEPGIQGLAFASLGYAERELGHYPEALEMYQRSLDIQQALGNRRSVAVASLNIGTILHNAGDYETAARRYREALAVFEETGGRGAAAVVLHNLGALESSLGRHERAIALYMRSMKTREELGDAWGVARLHENLGAAKASMGAMEEAERHFTLCRDMMRRMGNLAGEASALCNLANAMLVRGDCRGASERLDEALETLKDMDEKSVRAQALHMLSSSRARCGDYEGAVASASESADLSRRIGSAHGLFFARLALGEALRSLGRGGEALAELRQAASEMESLRAMLSEDSGRSDFLGSRLSIYEKMAGILLESPARPPSRGMEISGNGAEAFAVSERMKARSFLDEMGAARFMRGGVPPGLMERRRLLEARMKWLKERE